MRLLFAEDNVQLRTFVVRALTDAGFEVVAAADGDETLRLYRDRGPFDLILLDEDMPRRNGRAVLASIRSAGDGVPAVIWSGDLDLDAAESAALGVAALLHKPLGPSALITVLRNVIAATPEPAVVY